MQCEHTVGIPKGLFSSVPGLGIHTLLVGLTFDPSFRLFTSLKRAAGDRDFTPSTQHRFLASVILGYPSDRKTLCVPGLHQRLLESANRFDLTTLRSFEYALLQLKDSFLGFAPVQLPPFHRRLVPRFRHFHCYLYLFIPVHREYVCISPPLQRGIRFLLNLSSCCIRESSYWVSTDRGQTRGYFVPNDH